MIWFSRKILTTMIVYQKLRTTSLNQKLLFQIKKLFQGSGSLWRNVEKKIFYGIFVFFCGNFAITEFVLRGLLKNPFLVKMFWKLRRSLLLLERMRFNRSVCIFSEQISTKCGCAALKPIKRDHRVFLVFSEE